MVKDYYQILGVHQTAHQSDIKRAYRRLVQKLHPDVNPDPVAQELIKEVNEAYDVLGDEARRKEYNYKLEHPLSTIEVEPAHSHRDPRYRKGAYRPPQPKRPTQRDLMLKALPYLKPVTWAGCLICLLLAVDFFGPRNSSVETVEHFRTKTYPRGGWQGYVITDSGREFRIPYDIFEQIKAGQELAFMESAVLGVLIRVESINGSLKMTNLATLYGNFVFVPLLLLVFSVTGLTRLGNIEFKFNLGVVNAFVLIFTLILMVN